MPGYVFKTSDTPQGRTTKLNFLRQTVSNLIWTGGGLIDDTAFTSSWNGVTAIAPSKNVTYDKFAALGTTSGTMTWTDTIGGSTNISFSSAGAVVINEQGNAVNFRVESDTNAGALFVDGTNNRVGIFTQTPTVAFNVEGATVFNDTGADVDFRIESDLRANMFFLDAGNSRIGIGTATPDEYVHVYGTAGDAGTDPIDVYLYFQHEDASVGNAVVALDARSSDSGPFVHFMHSGTGYADLELLETDNPTYAIAAVNDFSMYSTGNSKKLIFGTRQAGDPGVVPRPTVTITRTGTVFGDNDVDTSYLAEFIGASNIRQVVVLGSGTQAVPILEVQNSSTTPLFYVNYGGGIVCNESGGSGSQFDTRMEGDTVTNLFHLVSSEDRVYIGASSGGSTLLHVAGTANVTGQLTTESRPALRYSLMAA